jgi:hypothetical protein
MFLVTYVFSLCKLTSRCINKSRDVEKMSLTLPSSIFRAGEIDFKSIYVVRYSEMVRCVFIDLYQESSSKTLAMAGSIDLSRLLFSHCCIWTLQLCRCLPVTTALVIMRLSASSSP